MKIKADKETAVMVGYGLLIATLIGAAGYGIWYFFIRSSDVNKDLDKLKNQGMLPTINDSQAQGYADVLDSLLDTPFIQMSSVFDVFNRCANLADVLLIISKYGTHFHFSISYVGNYTLPEFIRLRLSQTNIDIINTGLAAKNINYRF